MTDNTLDMEPITLNSGPLNLDLLPKTVDLRSLKLELGPWSLVMIAYKPSCKVTVNVVRFKQKLECSDDFPKSYFMKIR